MHHPERPSLVARSLARWRQPRARDPGAGELSYRYLARQIETDLPAGDAGRVVLISSPVPLALSNEACLLFAHSLASELGRRVLVMDGTFGDGGVGSALGHAGAPGFVDLVYGADSTLADLVVPTSHADVAVLPGGRTGVAHLLPIEAGRLAALFAAATASFDYVVLQQGAIFGESRYLQFTRFAHMVLMLVEEGETPVEELQRCLYVFRDHQVANVRVVLAVSR